MKIVRCSQEGKVTKVSNEDGKQLVTIKYPDGVKVTLNGKHLLRVFTQRSQENTRSDSNPLSNLQQPGLGLGLPGLGLPGLGLPGLGLGLPGMGLPGLPSFEEFHEQMMRQLVHGGRDDSVSTSSESSSDSSSDEDNHNSEHPGPLQQDTSAGPKEEDKSSGSSLEEEVSQNSSEEVKQTAPGR